MECCSDFQVYHGTNYSFNKKIISSCFSTSLLKCRPTLQGDFSVCWDFSTGFVLKYRIFQGLFYCFVKYFDLFSPKMTTKKLNELFSLTSPKALSQYGSDEKADMAWDCVGCLKRIIWQQRLWVFLGQLCTIVTLSVEEVAMENSDLKR